MTTWAAALDDFEARLDAQRAALDAGTAGDLSPFLPPIGLGPLPAALGDRARDLLAQARDLEQELGDNVTALAQDLAVVRKVGASTGEVRPATFVDFSA
jgi:hypothetical protein